MSFNFSDAFDHDQPQTSDAIFIPYERIDELSNLIGEVLNNPENEIFKRYLPRPIAGTTSFNQYSVSKTIQAVQNVLKLANDERELAFTTYFLLEIFANAMQKYIAIQLREDQNYRDMFNVELFGKEYDINELVAAYFPDKVSLTDKLFNQSPS